MVLHYKMKDGDSQEHLVLRDDTFLSYFDLRVDPDTNSTGQRFKGSSLNRHISCHTKSKKKMTNRVDQKSMCVALPFSSVLP